MVSHLNIVKLIRPITHTGTKYSRPIWVHGDGVKNVFIKFYFLECENLLYRNGEALLRELQTL